MKKTLTIYFLILSSLFLASCGSSVDSFFEDIKNNKIKSVKAAQRLINKGADIYEKDNNDSTLLHVVGNVELAEFFLEQGLNIEARNSRGESPLYTTIKRGHYDVALMLKQRGAFGFAETNSGDKPYNVAGLLLYGDLSPAYGDLTPEDRKLLEEIAILIWKEDVYKDDPINQLSD